MLVARELMSAYIREVYQKLEQQIDGGPTVIVAPAAALGARLLNERRGVPLVTLLLQPALVRSMTNSPRLPCTLMGDGVPHWLKRLQYWFADRFVIDRLLGPELNRARAELGLPPVRGIMREWWTSSDLVIGLFPDWFAPPQSDWPKQLKLTGFPLWDDGDHAPLEPELEAFLEGGPPPIVFTAGSAMMHGQAFFQTATDACRLSGRRGILVAKYPNQTPPQLPPEVKHFRFVPFSRIFPRAAAVVHHGGIGSCAQGLAAGVPQLIMPMSHDQPDNAARLERLGVAASLMRKKFTANRLADRLTELLDCAWPCALLCHGFANRLKATDAVAATCEQIESFGGIAKDPSFARQASSKTLGSSSGAASLSSS